MDTSIIEPPSGRPKRRHSEDFKAGVVEACRKPGISMAAVALANGLNANMLRKWVRQANAPDTSARAPVPQATRTQPNLVQHEAPTFLSLPLSQPGAAAGDIRLELERSGTMVRVTWPGYAVAECAQWLREVLR